MPSALNRLINGPKGDSSLAGLRDRAILEVLLAEVIEEPELNNKKYLEKRARELMKMDLAKLRNMAKEKIEEKREEEDKAIKSRHWVK